MRQIREDFQKNNAFLLNDLNGHALSQKKKRSLGVMKFTALVDSTVVIIIIYLVCLIYACE